MAKIKIETLGTSFTIQADGDEKYLNDILGYYQRITQDIQKIDNIKNPLQVAILAGITAVDELYKAKEKCIAMENGTYIPTNDSDSEEVEKRTLAMIDKISKVL